MNKHMNKTFIQELTSIRDSACQNFVLGIAPSTLNNKTGFMFIYEVHTGYYLSRQTWLTMPKTVSRM